LTLNPKPSTVTSETRILHRGKEENEEEEPVLQEVAASAVNLNPKP